MDYDSTQLELTFQSNPNIEPQCIDIFIIDDSVLEDSETFLILLSTLDPGANVSQSSSTASITDNDGKM